MRLGEILIASGLLTGEQLSEALARQAHSRGRLGTQLVQLGFVSADQVALALGKQHQVPPVMVRHFVHHDPAVLQCISAQIAAEHFILPIAYSRKGGSRSLVVCLRDPRNTELLARLQDKLQVPVLASVASELAIRVYLEKYYQVDAVAPQKAQVGRPASTEEDVDVDFSDDAGFSGSLDSFDLVELDHHQVFKAAPALFVPEAQRSSGIQDALRAAAAVHARAQALPARIDAAPVTADAAPAVAETAPPMADARPRAQPENNVARATADDEAPTPLEELLSSIQRADRRPEVSDAIMTFLRQRFAAGLIFTIKDGLAMGYRGFGGHLDDEDTVAALMLPLANTIFGLAHDTRELWRGDPKTRSSAAQHRFLTLFAMHDPPVEVVVAPVFIGPKVLCLIYAHGESGAALSTLHVGELAAISSATNQAFERIIRNARKSS